MSYKQTFSNLGTNFPVQQLTCITLGTSFQGLLQPEDSALSERPPIPLPERPSQPFRKHILCSVVSHRQGATSCHRVRSTILGQKHDRSSRHKWPVLCRRSKDAVILRQQQRCTESDGFSGPVLRRRSQCSKRMDTGDKSSVAR